MVHDGWFQLYHVSEIEDLAYPAGRSTPFSQRLNQTLQARFGSDVSGMQAYLQGILAFQKSCAESQTGQIKQQKTHFYKGGQRHVAVLLCGSLK